MQTFFPRWRRSLLLFSFSLPAVAWAAAPELRYQFKAGADHVYSLHVEANEPRLISTLDGLVTYHVKSATADALTVTAKGALRNGHKAKEGMGYARPPMGPGMGGMLRVGGFRFGAPPFAGGSFVTPDEIEINAKGEVLPPVGKDTFEVTGGCTVILDEKVSVTPMTYRLKEVRMPGKEKITYTVGAVDGDVVAIRKSYELKTTATVAGVPRFEMKGEGTNIFDVKRGLLREFGFDATIVEASENVTVRTPLKVVCKLLEGDALAAAKKAAELPPRAELKPLSDDDRASLLADLRSPDKNRRTVALSRFTTAKPAGDKAAVAALLLPLLKDTEQFTRQNAAKALGVWGAADVVEPLLALLADPQFNVRWAAMEALGLLHDARAAAPLAGMIAEKKDTHLASQALKVLGGAAEPEVLKLLDAPAIEARREAAQILKVIGTAASTAPLEKAASDKYLLLAMFAKQALKDVKERK